MLSRIAENDRFRTFLRLSVQVCVLSVLPVPRRRGVHACSHFAEQNSGRLSPSLRSSPSPPTVAVAVALFVACYDFSGQLAEQAASAGVHDWLTLDAPLAAIAIATFVVFERSPGGLFMMFLLFIIGPVVEVGLINQLGLYAYTDPDFMGIPSWICWVYAAGGPANGALGRQVLAALEEYYDSDKEF